MKEKDEIKPGFIRKAGKVLLWIAGIWIAAVLLIEAALTSQLATKAVNRLAGEYIDGNLEFGKVSVSIFRDFPNLSLVLEDFRITYPSDRFDAQEKKGPQGRLMFMGCADEADTLASFRTFTASVQVPPLLFGKIIVPEIELVKPRIFIHTYDDRHANWNIFITGDNDSDSSEEADTTSTGSMPDISLSRIDLTEHPHIVFTDSRDTIFAMIDLKQAEFDGRISTADLAGSRIGFSLDSMLVAGRVASDTLALGLNRLRVHEDDGRMNIAMDANSSVATRAFGRMKIPFEMETVLHFPEDSVPAIDIEKFTAEIAAVPFDGDAKIRLLEGRTDIDVNLSVTECKVDDMIRKFIRNFIPEAEDIVTDASLNIYAKCNGEYVHKTGKLPTFRVDLQIPDSKVQHKKIGETVRLALDAYVANTRKGSFNVTINDIVLSTKGLSLSGYGNAKDILSADPTISVEGNLSASIDSLMAFLPDSLNIIAEGGVQASISGSTRLSQLNMYNFSKSSLTGELSSERIVFKAPDDTIEANINGLAIKLGPESRVSRRDSTRAFKLMGITGNIGSLEASYGQSLALKGENVTVSAKNSANGIDTSKVNLLSGSLAAGKLSLTDAAGSRVSFSETRNRFSMRPKRGNPIVPVLALTSSNKRITLVTDANRAILTDASIKADATLNTVERRERMRQRLDSLQRVYPDVPRDSLLFRARAERQAREVPSWMKEEDFNKQDIDIRLDQSLAKYFREWDLNGDVDIRTGIVMTPYFPLRNILRGMQLSFTNDRIAIDSLKFMTGKSMVGARGELKGLRRALTARTRSRSALELGVEIYTDGMDANEILSAYSAGSNFNPESLKGDMSETSDADFLKMVVSDTLEAPEETKLIVIPANLKADISLDGKNIKYSDLDIYDLDARLLMKERCVQISNTMATSNIGDVGFEGFYATRSKQDIKAGFNFEFKDITADKAIRLMPAVDSIMPLLKSFGGKLNCELAATASLDTNMNVLPPSINGVMRISGDDLTVTDSDLFTSIAKKLKFDNNKSGKIDNMTVEGVIKDNIFEVFPFVIKLDRYTLALSGKQNFDMSYKYHASIIKSPLVIRVGVDVYGTDFDHMKFKIGKPKYKNENVPVFTTVIDETKINLAESIRNIFEKGVDAAVKENERQEAILEFRKETGFINAVDQETEELSAEEQKQLEDENMESADNNNESTTENNQ